MKKILICFMSLIMTMTMLVGCGSKDNDIKGSNDKKQNETVNKGNNIKATNLATSYTKYLEEKAERMETIQEVIDGSDNYMLPLALLPLAMVDLVMLPASICGLEEEAAVAGLAFLYNDINYKRDGNNCTVTYKDENRGKVKFESQYDPKTDSASITVYEDNEPAYVSEYIKIKDGYASQYYIYNNDDGSTALFTAVFVGDDIYSSAFEDVDKPKSIYKNNKIGTDFAKGGTVWYIEIVDGVSKVLFDGEEVNLNFDFDLEDSESE
ncbi:MAG: hypothetical protein PHS45_05285 [Bacilli bacterium]|nr:hypothetical protein [Bacilli bacterium]